MDRHSHSALGISLLMCPGCMGIAIAQTATPTPWHLHNRHIDLGITGASSGAALTAADFLIAA